MTELARGGLFIAEGSSDLPLAEVVEALFQENGVFVHLSKPDFSRLPRISKDVKSRVKAGVTLVGGPVDVIVVHRDADNVGPAPRRHEIESAVREASPNSALVPVIPVRMTEAWLLLDEAAIRTVAQRPNGRAQLNLPKVHEVEKCADPKDVLRKALLNAAEVTGRRKESFQRRFDEHRRQLLERIDRDSAISRLDSWKQLADDVREVAERWRSGANGSEVD